MTRPWSVPPMWQGETVAILASGPSMTREQAEAVRGKCRVLCINNTAIPTEIDGVLQPAFAPWADLLYAADGKWWHCYKDRALKFAGLKVTIKPNPFPEVLQLQQSPERTFDKRPTHLASGGNSGYQGLQVAVKAGAKRIILLGFDMRDGGGRRRHYFGNHPPRLNSSNAYVTWIHAFRRLAPVLQQMGVEVLNCTPKSALQCFKRTTLQEAIGVSVRQVETSGGLRAADPAAGPGDGGVAHGMVEAVCVGASVD